MSKREDYEKRTEELLGPIAKECGVYIYDVEYVKEGKDFYLRSYIDKSGGVTIEDCESVSRALSDALDAEDFIPDAYIMEVSSPGLGRALKKDRHLEMSLGDSVDIHFYKAINGSKELTGLLKAYNKDTVTIEVEGMEQIIERKDIASIFLTLNL